jgi:hypothetical protein
LRQRIDVAVVRALADRRYATQLLTDPADVLMTPDAAAEHQSELRAIHAQSVKEFARLALARFWPGLQTRHRRASGRRRTSSLSS